MLAQAAGSRYAIAVQSAILVQRGSACIVLDKISGLVDLDGWYRISGVRAYTMKKKSCIIISWKKAFRIGWVLGWDQVLRCTTSTINL
jgi:hypothetical protein